MVSDADRDAEALIRNLLAAAAVVIVVVLIVRAL